MFWPTDGRLSSWGGLLKVMRENRNQKLNNKLKEFHPHPLALTPLTQLGDFYVNIIYKAESSPFDYNICFRARESANVYSRRSRRCYSYILLLDCALLIPFEHISIQPKKIGKLSKYTITKRWSRTVRYERCDA